MLENLLANKTNIRILRLLSRKPNKFFSVSEIQDNTGVGLGNLYDSINLLRYHGALLVEGKNISRYKINMMLGDILNIFKKESLIFQNIDLNIIKILADIEKEIVSNFQVEKVFLFGSIARGDYTDKSDIDIAVVGVVNKIKLTQICEKFSRQGRDIQVQVFDRKTFEKGSRLIDNIKKEGISLVG